jgi:hypothetical protein
MKLNGSNKIIFKDGDVIYFTNIDTSGITFHYTDDNSIKTKKAKDKKLENFLIEYDSKYSDVFFKPFTNQKKDSLKTPKKYISDRYNTFPKILGSESWSSTKYKHKNLIVRNIDWEIFNNQIVNEIYYRPSDSLQIEIPMPKDIVGLCNEIKSKYSDAKYLILFRNIYVTYNIFEGGEVPGQIFGVPGTSSFQYAAGYELDDALFISPKIVIDIYNAKLLSIDAQNHPIYSWDEFIWDINWMIYEEAEYYNLFF